jgi:hypothetical protein
MRSTDFRLAGQSVAESGGFEPLPVDWTDLTLIRRLPRLAASALRIGRIWKLTKSCIQVEEVASFFHDHLHLEG